MSEPFGSLFVGDADGIRLHARDYGRSGAAQAVVCLPGLARTCADFDPLARRLVADDPARRVIALDYRGRGLSGRDPDPTRYDLSVESDDILAVLAAAGVSRAIIVGTSRGGLHAMLLAARAALPLDGVVLNDIGPVLEPAGLARIQGYVGRLPVLNSWEDAVAALRRVAGAQFTGLDEAGWLHYARTTFGEDADGRLAALYDPAIAHNLAKLDPSALPALWEAFDALAPVPLMVIRGAASDLLSVQTVAAMAARHPECTVLTVAGQGHAPLLIDTPTLDAVAAFVARCGRGRNGTPTPGDR